MPVELPEDRVPWPFRGHTLRVCDEAASWVGVPANDGDWACPGCGVLLIHKSQFQSSNYLARTPPAWVSGASLNTQEMTGPLERALQTLQAGAMAHWRDGLPWLSSGRRPTTWPC